MKRIWVYLLGVVSGVVLTIIVLLIIGNMSQKTNLQYPGATFYETVGEDIGYDSFKVFQSLGDNGALAEPQNRSWNDDLLFMVMLWNDEGIPYYDQQVVTAPTGKCFRQIGIYRFENRMGVEKTVPIVSLSDK